MNKRITLYAARLFLALVLLFGQPFGQTAAAASAAAGTQQVASKLIFPTIIYNASFNTEIQLHNPNNMQAIVTVTLSGAGGTFNLNTVVDPNGTRLVTQPDFQGAGTGVYSATVTSSTLLDGVALVYRLPGTLIALVPGLDPSTAGARLFFGPVYRDSGLTLMNPASSPANLTIDLYRSDGLLTLSLSQLVQPNASMALNFATQSQIPAGFSGLAVVSSTQPVLGLLTNKDQVLANHPAARIYLPLKSASPLYYARLLRAADDAGGPRTSSYFLANLGTAPATAQDSLYGQDGSLSNSLGYSNLSPQSSQVVNLAARAVPEGWRGSLKLESDQALGFNDLTEYVTQPDNISNAYYDTGVDTSLSLPRLVSTGDRHSVISVDNTSTSAAEVTLALYASGGQALSTLQFPVDALGSKRVDLATLLGPAANFTGAAVLSASQPVTAVVDEFYTYVPPCSAPSVTLSHAPEDPIYPGAVTFTASVSGTGPFTYTWSLDGTSLPDSGSSITPTLSLGDHTVSVSVTGACGTGGDTHTVTVLRNPNAPTVSLSRSPAGTVYSTDALLFTANVTSGASPFSYAWTLDGAPAGTNSPALSLPAQPAGSHSVGVTVSNSYGSDSASDTFQVNPPPCVAPHVTLSHTPTTLYPTTLIHFSTSVTGTAPSGYTWTVDGGNVSASGPTFDTPLSEGSHTVTVKAVNGCGSDTDTETVTVSPPPCSPPTLTLSQFPAGVIYPSSEIHFIASAGGSAPFNYQWNQDGNETVGTDSPLFATSLPAGDHYVSATASNRCGAYTYTRSFTVVAEPVSRPDLSMSTINASVSGAKAGDPIEYIAVLRNTGQQPSQNSLFTNSIPGYTSYVAGSAQASDGSPVTFDQYGLKWTGSVIPGSPVVITYKVKMGSQAPLDGKIRNDAYIQDSQNTETRLSDVVYYQPGYTFLIDNGALGTNDLNVNLSFTYDPAANLKYYQVSNDEAFSSAGKATGWLELKPGQTTHPDWALDPYGDPRQPRTVYLKYKDGSGKEVGPFMATILYDVQPPDAPQVDASPVLAAALPGVSPSSTGAAAAGPTWSVTTSDDNSGVAFLEISTSPDFASKLTTRVAVTGLKITFSWHPLGPGAIYLRAIDRSGNASTTITLDGFKFVYLPFLKR